jgi:hypothetical protein
MTVIATKDKNVLSSVLADDMNGLVADYNFAHGQTAGEAANTEYKVGQVVIWSTNRWEILANADTINTVSTAATAGKSLGVVVGFDSLGDVGTATVGSAGRDVVVLYQGPAKIKEQGLVFAAGVGAPKVAEAKAALAAAGLKLVNVAATLAVTHYS